MKRCALLLILSFFFVFVSFSQSAPASLLILNARVADGTGAPLRNVAVRISGDRIIAVGRLKPHKDEKVLDARGLVLAPGFIDIHNHSTEGLDSDPLAETQIAQGITTAIQGPDGGSPWPIASWLETRRKTPPLSMSPSWWGMPPFANRSWAPTSNDSPPPPKFRRWLTSRNKP